MYVVNGCYFDFKQPGMNWAILVPHIFYGPNQAGALPMIKHGVFCYPDAQNTSVCGLFCHR